MSVYKKILLLMTPIERKRGLLILLLVTIMAMLETLGIASLMPFLAVLSDPSLIQDNKILSKGYQLSSSFLIKDEDQFLLLLGVISFVIIILSSMYKVYTYYKMYQFLEMLRHSVASRLTESFLYQPYTFFLTKDSSDITKTVLSEVDAVIGSVIRPTYLMVANSFVLIAVIVLLVIANPLLLLTTAGLIGALYFLIYYKLRLFIQSIGEQRLNANKSRFSVLNEALNNIKFVKFYARESDYVSKFRVESKTFADSVAKFLTLNQVPKYLIEGIAFGGLISLVLLLLAFDGGLKGGALGTILPTIGLYAFAVYRLQPALQGIFNGFSALKYGEVAIDNLLVDIQSVKEIDKQKVLGKNLEIKSSINLNDINFSYSESSIKVLKKINLSIAAGSKIGVVGKTGSGKTTLIDIILGLLKPELGSLTIDGVKVDMSNISEWKKNIGYVPQDIILNDAPILENIAYGVKKEKIDTQKVISCAKHAQLHDFVINSTTDGYQTYVGERGVRLSGGQRQRLGIARALYHDPAVLIFDEATSALDSETEIAVMQSLNSISKDRTVILIAHRLSTLENCDRIIRLEDGMVAFDGNFHEFCRENVKSEDT
jgi:ABC-type multidrug transport system fused ATPase/permease subunit